ncbi:MAG: Hsp20/alpha crystallin family protein [Flavobacteriia bacterium]|nr:Hsp20/alpha crystallin family protein [Flavobacteriia bacterium]
MSLVKRSSYPFFNDDLFDFFGNDRFFKKENVPAVNIKETENSFEIEAKIPGFKKEEIKIEIEQGVLQISGESSSEKETKEDKYTRKEFTKNSFSRSFQLPENTLEEDIKANYVDGILKLSVNKKSQKELPLKKQISIQ